MLRHAEKRRRQIRKVFRGEDMYDYPRDKRSRHREAVDFTRSAPRKSALIPKSENLLLQKLSRRFVSVPCIICNRVFTTHTAVDMSRGRPRLARPESVPEFVMDDGHAFHEACLFSYLTEPWEQNFIVCNKCEIVKAFVSVQKWDSVDIEQVMDRVPNVTILS